MEIDLDRANERLKQLVAEPNLTALQAALGTDSALHLVGGTVRDILLERAGSDIDLATSLLPDQVRTRLEGAGIHVVPTGLKHQTVTAVLDGSHYEITTFRGPGMRSSGGVVHGNSIEQDLIHRDFTINALAYSFQTKEIVDVLNGVQDLRREKVRTCGSPNDRFEEDPLRMLRLIRIAMELSFSIDEKSAKAAHTLAHLLEGVSVERMREEMIRILLSPEPRRGFIILAELGLLNTVLPEMIPSVGCEQNRFHSDDVFLHTLEVIEKTEPELIVRLSALFHDIGKPHTISIDGVTGERHFFKHETVGAEITREALKRLKFSNEIREAVSLLVQTHMRPLDAGPPGLRRLLRDTGDYFEHWRKLKEADTLSTKIDPSQFKKAIADFDERMEEIKKGPPVSPLASLAIKGKDLLDKGFPESPKIGIVLRALHEKVLDDLAINERETLLKMSEEIFKELN